MWMGLVIPFSIVKATFLRAKTRGRRRKQRMLLPHRSQGLDGYERGRPSVPPPHGVRHATKNRDASLGQKDAIPSRVVGPPTQAGTGVHGWGTGPLSWVSGPEVPLSISKHDTRGQLYGMAYAPRLCACASCKRLPAKSSPSSRRGWHMEDPQGLLRALAPFT